MTAVEIEFLEEYKRFDRLCADMLGCKEGVTAYIEECEKYTDSLYARQMGIKDDYYTLKHLRHIRNKITHDSGFSGCTEDDLDALKALHSRFLAVDDPLSRVRKLSEPKYDRPKKNERTYKPIAEEITDKKPSRSGKFLKFLLVLLSLGVLGISVFSLVYFLFSGVIFGV